MNTQTLRENFKEVYRDFFSRCELVVSAPLNISITGDYLDSCGGLMLQQKFPLRIYVGFEVNPGVDHLSFGSCLYFTQLVNQGKFVDGRINPTVEANLLQYIEKIFYQSRSKLTSRYTFHVLAEAPLMAGWGNSSGLAATLAVGLSLLHGSVTIQEVNQWQTNDLIELTSDPLYNRIFQLAWQFRIIIRGGQGSGHGLVMVDSYYPIIFWTKPLPRTMSDPIKISNNPYFAYRFENLVDEGVQGGWPFDFGLINSGPVSDSNIIFRGTKILETVLAETPKRTYQLFAHLPLTSPGNWSTIFKEPSPDSYQIPRILSMRALLTLKTLFDQGISNERIEGFFQAINLYQDSLRLLGASDRVVDGIITSLNEQARGWHLPVVAAKIVGGRGGVLFMTPSGSIRDEINGLVDKLRERFDPRIHLAYASWVDGYGYEGIRVEQMVVEKIYSPLISHGALLVGYLTSRGDLQTHLFSKEHFQQMVGHQDIIFDSIDNTVITRGQRLTSQEIHSASATIQIFDVLIKRCGQAVKNSDLPESTYAQDRNELQSKIITPLNQALMKRLGRRLPVKITGGVTEFTITLQPGLPIYFIKKVF